MIKFILADSGTNQAIETPDAFNTPFSGVKSQERALLTANISQSHGVFSSVNHTSATTTTIASPSTQGSLALTDILISGEKKNAATAVISFTDDSSTVPIFQITVTDAPVNIAHSFGGRFQGWRGARVDLTTDTNGDITVTLGYVKVPSSIPYLEWDEFR